MSSVSLIPPQVLFPVLLLLFWGVVRVEGVAKTFYFHTQSGTPNAAMEVCFSYNATMVSISNEREQQVFLKLIDQRPEFQGNSFWIGLFHVGGNVFSWACSNKDGISFNKWGTSQPGVYGSSHCVEVREDNLWYSSSCHSSYKFICEKKRGSCDYSEDISFTAVNVSSSLLSFAAISLTECQTKCESLNNGESCFYILYETIARECYLLESTPSAALASAIGVYTGYSRDCYSGVTRTEAIPIVAGSTNPPASKCPAAAFASPGDPTVASPDDTTVTSSEKITARQSTLRRVFTTTEAKTSADHDMSATTVKTTTYAGNPRFETTSENTKTSSSSNVDTSAITTPTTSLETDVTAEVIISSRESISETPIMSTVEHKASETATVVTSTETQTPSSYVTIQSETSRVLSTLKSGTSQQSTAKTTTTSLDTDVTAEVKISSREFISETPILSTVEHKASETATVASSTETQTPSLHSTFQSETSSVLSTLKSGTSQQSIAKTTTTTQDTKEISTLLTAPFANVFTEVSTQTISHSRDVTLSQKGPTQQTEGECYCLCAKGSYSVQEKEMFIQQLLDDLSVDKNTFSAHVRKLNSASDPRPSAKVVGCTGLVLLVTAFVSIVLLDLTTIFRDLKKINESLKLWLNGKSLGELNDL